MEHRLKAAEALEADGRGADALELLRPLAVPRISFHPMLER
jgi:hypothetical protein